MKFKMPSVIMGMFGEIGTGKTKTDEFSEKFRRGGGPFNPKIYIAKFGPLNRASSA